MAAAIRRFISRYLSGKRADVDVNESQDLISQLTRNDLWKLNLTDDQDRFNSDLYQLSFGLKVNQAYQYYELLGGDQIDTNFETNQNENNIREGNSNNMNQLEREQPNDLNDCVERDAENNGNQNIINEGNGNDNESINHGDNNKNNDGDNDEDNDGDNDEENDDDNDQNEDEEISC